ncbi:MAG: hypothetical protein NVS2B16_35290 [Chloroflexota bacterium]
MFKKTVRLQTCSHHCAGQSDSAARPTGRAANSNEYAHVDCETLPDCDLCTDRGLYTDCNIH